MMPTRVSMGFALLATVAACAQIPVDSPINNAAPPLATRGASSAGYDIDAPTRAAPPLLRPAPVVRTALPPAPLFTPAAVPPPIRTVAAPAPAPLPTYAAPAPLPSYAAPAPAVVPAPVAETRAFTVLERVAALDEPEPLPQSTGRQFRPIEVAALDPSALAAAAAAAEDYDPLDQPVGPSADWARGAQVTTAAPFSISTGSTGRPYYEGSTPPTIEYHIPHIPQEEPLWCWAAAAQQAIGWVNNGRAPAQCAIVALAHGLDVEECCADREGICARTGEIPAIEKLIERFGGQGRELATVPRDPETIYDILRGGDTLLIRIRPAPHDEAVGIRHMIVVRGIEWLRLPNNQLQATLIYNDPLGAGERAVNFDEIEGFFEQALVVSRT